MCFLLGLLLEELYTVLKKTLKCTTLLFMGAGNVNTQGLLWKWVTSQFLLQSVSVVWVLEYRRKKRTMKSQWEEKNTLQANSNRKYQLILNACHIPLKSSHPWLSSWLPSAGYCVPGAFWFIVPVIQVWKFTFCRLYWKTNCSQTPSGTRPIRGPITKIIWQIKFSYRKDDGKLSCHWKKRKNQNT